MYIEKLYLLFIDLFPPLISTAKSGTSSRVRKPFTLGKRLYEAQKEMRLSSDRFAICMRPVISYVLRKDHMHPAGKLILVQILKTPYSNWYVNYGGNIPKINLNS